MKALSTKQINWLTSSIIKSLEDEKIPWVQPWFSLNHRNYLTKRGYTGLNPLILSAHAHEHGYKSNYWMTYKQAVDNNIKVTGGYKLAPIVKAGYQEITEDGKKTDRFYFYMKMFTVINGDFLDLPKEEVKEIETLQQPETVKENYIKTSHIQYQEQGNRAYYSPTMDKINLPPRQHFKSSEDYYSVFFHEAGHSTGHKSRLNREGIANFDMFGSHQYSQEELVAELTSAYTMKTLGLESTINQSKAYIQSWLKTLKNNPDWIIKASSKANKAHQLLLGVQNDIK